MGANAARILIYCQDSFGLGHLRRNVSIAHQVSRLAPNTITLFVADSPLAPFFTLPPNSEFVKLPTVVKVAAGEWQAHRLGQVKLDRIINIRAQVLNEVVLNFRPDVLLVDHMPQGARGELVECLKSLRLACPKSRIILGLRDILGAPEVIIRQWRTEGAFQIASRYYDQVLVYGVQDIYDVGREYQFSEDLEQKVLYCGYVSSDLPDPIQQSNLPSPFSTEKPSSVLVVGGGGSDAYPVMKTMVDAVRQLGEAVSFETLILTGPFMPEDLQLDLQKSAVGLPVSVKCLRGDSLQYVLQADLIVSMAGYNTICEILKFAKKAVVIPRAGPSAEQGIRSQILHNLALLHSIHPRDLTPQALAESICARLDEPRDASWPEAPDLNGARHAARFLLSQVSDC